MSIVIRSTVASRPSRTRAARSTAALLAAACSMAVAAQTRAETKTFSETGTDWLDPNNWSPVGVPLATDDVLINAGTADMALNASALTVQYITFSNTSDRLLGNTGAASSTLTLDGNGAVNPLISVTDTGIFTIRGGAEGVDVLDLVINGDGAFNVANSAGQLLISSAIGETGGARSLTKTGAGTMVLTGVNTFTGAVNIGDSNGIDNGGTLVMNADSRFGAVPAAATPNMINLYNGTLRLTNGTALTTVTTSAGGPGVAGVLVNINRGVSLNAGNGKIDVPDGQYAEIPGTISGTGALHKIGGGILDLRTSNNGNNDYAGGTIVEGGVLGVVKDGNFGAAGTPVEIRNGATIRWYSGGAVPAAGLVGRTLTIGAGGGTVDWSLSSGVPNVNHQIVSAAGNTLTKFGNDTVQVNVAQPNMNGDLHINQGRWNAHITGATGNGAIHLNAPDLLNTPGGTGVAQLGIGGSNLGLTVVVDNDIVLNPTGQGQSSFEVNTTNELMINGIVSGTGGLIKGLVANTSGMLTLTAANIYSGDTEIKFGTIRVANGAAIPDGSSVIMPNIVNVRLDLNDANETIGGLSGGGNNGGHVTLGAGTLTINQAANTTYSGIISGTGNITKSGAGTLTLTRTAIPVSTYSGDTTISGGVLAIGEESVLGTSSILINGGTLQTTAPVAFTRNLTVGGLSGTVDTNAFDSSAPFVGGDGGINKVGTGKLTANQIYAAGTLAVNAGTVEVAPDGGALGTVEVYGLTVAPGALLAMNDNDIVVNYAVGDPSPEFALRDLVKAIAEGGTSGISFEPGDGNRVLAIAEGSESGLTNLNGVSFDETTVIGKHTYYGDANLDGQVTSDDYVAVDVGIGVGNSWVEGDFDFSSTVTSDDYVAIDVNLGQGSGNPLAFAELKAEMIALHTAMFGDEYVQRLAIAEAEGFAALVPEPGALSLIGLGAAGLLGRRRRTAR